MARKEKRGGNLRNEDIERELSIRGGEQKTGRSYRGSQDTGDTTPREYGTPVQRNDGLAPGDQQEEIDGGNRNPE